jgi:Skp family chaperone for outer membrane proteins
MENNVQKVDNNQLANPVLQEQQQYLKELAEASQKLQQLGTKLYMAPKTENDTNIFRIIVDTMKKMNRSKGERFEAIIKSREPNIEDKVDEVQKIIISSVLIHRLYEIKAENPELDILPILTLIPYYLDNQAFTECMITQTVPILVNNDII